MSNMPRKNKDIPLNRDLIALLIFVPKKIVTPHLMVCL